MKKKPPKKKVSVPMEQNSKVLSAKEETPKSESTPLSKTEVKNMILEAKIHTAERQISILSWFFGIIFGLFGIVLPLFAVLYQDNRIDKQIENMEARFKELAGLQLRKPIITCKVNNKPLCI